MSQDWYMWFPARYRAKTMHLTAEQDGIYRRLIDHYMETEQPLPDNDVALARIAGVTDIQWENASSILRAYFEHASSMLHHETCIEMLEERAKRKAKRTKIAKDAARERWKKSADKQQENASSMHEAMQNDAKQNKTKQKNITPIVPLPEWIDQKDWDDFKEMRKKQKAPLTQRAEELAISQLDKLRADGHDPQAVIQQSIMRGWKGLFAIGGGFNQEKQQPKQQKKGVITL